MKFGKSTCMWKKTLTSDMEIRGLSSSISVERVLLTWGFKLGVLWARYGSRLGVATGMVWTPVSPMGLSKSSEFTLKLILSFWMPGKWKWWVHYWLIDLIIQNNPLHIHNLRQKKKKNVIRRLMAVKNGHIRLLKYSMLSNHLSWGCNLRESGTS